MDGGVVQVDQCVTYPSTASPVGSVSDTSRPRRISPRSVMSTVTRSPMLGGAKNVLTRPGSTGIFRPPRVSRNPIEAPQEVQGRQIIAASPLRAPLGR
jgi:hypothetical protein